MTTHPIQYYAPWFKYISDFIDLQVFYMHQESAKERSKGDFGVAHEWDIDLLNGYEYTFLKNVAKEPSVHMFKGCDTPEIYNIIKEGHFDAVLVLGWYVKAFWQTIFACKRYKIPVLVRGDSQLQIEQSFIKKAIKRITYPMMLKIFDGFLYVGENNKKYLKHYNVDENKMFFCPHFIDQNSFYEKSLLCDKDELRKLFKANDNTVVLLFVGKFIEKKRPIDILKAMKLLQQEDIQAKAIFVGSGKLEEELKEYCNTNTELSVDFVGFKNQSELPMYYKLADILILPSSAGETWGLVVNEAYSVLTPAIVSDQVGCKPDMIDNGLTGTSFECGNIAELSKCIKDFIPKLGSMKIVDSIKEKNRTYSIELATTNLINAIREVEGRVK